MNEQRKCRVGLEPWNSITRENSRTLPLPSPGPSRFMHSAASCVCLVLTLGTLLSACTSLKVRMGRRIRLEKTPVVSIQASLPGGPGMAPGEASPLVVSITQSDGKILQTEGKGHGKILWKDLKVSGSLVAVDDKGIVRIAADPRLSDGKIPHVSVTVPSHPDMRAELDIPLRYSYPFRADFSGRRGADGSSGVSGNNGIDGFPGSTDPDHPRAGGDGSNGGNGGSGWSGGRGGDAPPVLVQVRLKSGDRPLLQVKVSGGGRDEFFLVDPQGGSLSVSADGGLGGRGGDGGRGGRGGRGGSGSPSGHDGSNGSDGSSGSDGPPGRGGAITVRHDPEATPFLGVIHLSSRHGPPPVFVEAAIPALW